MHKYLSILGDQLNYVIYGASWEWVFPTISLMTLIGEIFSTAS